ncbi:MAG: DoxX family protein [Limisphaerales bacterium]
MKKIFAPGNDSMLTSLALLTFRLWFGLTMCLNHGLDKINHWDQMAPIWLDPFHIGHQASFALSVFAEAGASMLLVFGLLTRFAAMVLVINMSVAFFMVHKGAVHVGELAFMYLGAFVTLLLAGGGTFSLDKLLFGKGK